MTTLKQDQIALALRFADGAIEPHDLSEFWSRLMKGDIAQDAIITFSRLEGDFPHWEMHPKGEELFILVDGAIDVVMQMPEGETVTRLKGGECLVMPRGVWHRACVVAPGQMIFLTFGEGTQHRPL